MNDINSKAKMSVLQELIEMMKEKEASGFKDKSSKFMAKAEPQVEAEQEESPEDMAETAKRFKEFKGMDGASLEDRFSNSNGITEDMNRPPDDDDEDIEKLKEMYSRIK